MAFRIKNNEEILGVDFGSKRNHLVYCKIRNTDEGFVITDWGCHDFGTACSMTDIDFFLSRTETITTLEQIFNADWFVLEAQPVRNAKTYALSHLICYFLFVLHPRLRRQNVRFLKPSIKFDILDPHRKLQKTITKKTSQQQSQSQRAIQARGYRSRKRHAIDITWSLLKTQHPRWTEFLKNAPKKDDFADAFCYAVAFLNKNKAENANLHAQSSLFLQVASSSSSSSSSTTPTEETENAT